MNPSEVDCPGTAVPTPGPFRTVCRKCPAYPPDTVWRERSRISPKVEQVV
jgi:hypothetical protein